MIKIGRRSIHVGIVHNHVFDEIHRAIEHLYVKLVRGIASILAGARKYLGVSERRIGAQIDLPVFTDAVIR